MFSKKVFEAVGEIIHSLQVVVQLEHSVNYIDIGHLLVECPYYGNNVFEELRVYRLSAQDIFVCR